MSSVGHTDRVPTSRISVEGLDIDELVSSSSNFFHVPRFPIFSEELSTTLADHEAKGMPLVVSDIHEHPQWPSEKFTLEYFAQTTPPNLNVRNVHTRRDAEMRTTDFIAQFQSLVAPSSNDSRRCYAKDAPCPDEWKAWLKDSDVIPEPCRQFSSNDVLQYTSSVETLMCYLGGNGTFTPMHKDNCASSGQNLMVYTKDSGSAFWFMTRSSDAPAVAQFFQSLEVPQVLDKESYNVSVEELRTAPFAVYITEQKLGDLVLVPPRSCHQVVNHGGLTVKASWSRMTVKGVAIAIRHELPTYRRVCRMETYRCKSLVYATLCERTRLLKQNVDEDIKIRRDSVPVAEMDFLIELFDEVLLDEYAKDHANLKHLDRSDHDGDTYDCDFCGADIFQSFFGCSRCAQKYDSDLLVICSGCYAEGRVCVCGRMTPYQCRPMKGLFEKRNDAVRLLNSISSRKPREELTSGKELLKTSIIGLFAAGLDVNEWRTREFRKSKLERMCNKYATDEDPKHQIDALHGVACDKCHRGLCFAHLLKNGVYSAYAIEASLRQDNDEELHRRHNSSSIYATFEEQRRRALDAEVSGDAPLRLFRIQLVLAAQAFPYCLPINERAEPYINLGWYDQLLSSAQSSARIMDMSSTNNNTGEWRSSPSEDDMPLRSLAGSPEISDNTTLVHESTSSSKRVPSSRFTRSRSVAVEVDHIKRKRKSMDSPVEPPRQERKRKPNVKASDTRPYVSAPIPPTDRAATSQFNDDQPMSQVQDPGASRSSDSNSDVSHRSEELFARIIQHLERQSTAKDKTSSDLTWKLDRQTKCIKDLHMKVTELETKSAMLEEKLGVMERQGEMLLSRMEELLPRDDEYAMDERSVTEPPNASMAPTVQPRLFPPPQGNLGPEVAPTVPVVNNQDGWATSSRDGYVMGPPQIEEDNAVEIAYATTAYSNNPQGRRTHSQPTYSQDNRNQYNVNTQSRSQGFNNPRWGGQRYQGGRVGQRHNPYNQQHPRNNTHPQVQQNGQFYSEDRGFNGSRQGNQPYSDYTSHNQNQQSGNRGSGFGRGRGGPPGPRPPY